MSRLWVQFLLPDSPGQVCTLPSFLTNMLVFLLFPTAGCRDGPSQGGGILAKSSCWSIFFGFGLVFVCTSF